jgi:hypothetical protein
MERQGGTAQMNWFEKHLHLMALFFLVAWVSIGMAFVNHEAALAIVGITGELLFLALSAWILRRKGQSLWFLLAVLFLMWLIFLIPNKNSVRKTIEYEYPDEQNA